MRFLRHHHDLRAEAAHEIVRATDCGTGSPARTGLAQRSIHRGRQLHREFEECAAAIARPGGLGSRHGRPFSFYTEASVDLADRPELMGAMTDANFMYVFLGIETPSEEALKSSKKFQNLRRDVLEQVRIIQASGLWVLAGFIVG